MVDEEVKGLHAMITKILQAVVLLLQLAIVFLK
jgi:hypothetical protein